MRKDFDEVLRRNIDFASESVQSGALIQIKDIYEITPPRIKPLEEWSLPEEAPAYMDAYVENLRALWEKRQDIDDDQLPTLKPFFGIAEHTAFVGGKVVYGGGTSYHEHPLKDINDVDELEFREDNENFSMLMNSMRYLKAKSETEGFIATLRGGEAPMDMANGIRGNDIFTDFYDNPDKVHKLIDFCLRASLWTFGHQKKIIGQREGGTMSGLGIWIPGNSIGHLSEDASSLCSPDIYREFGRPYTEKLMEHFDCGLMHVHTYGRHILPDICAIEKLKFIQLEYDPNQPSPIQVYREYEETLEGKIVVLRATKAEIEENLDFLKNRKSILWVDTEMVDEAKELIASVRKMSDF